MASSQRADTRLDRVLTAADFRYLQCALYGRRTWGSSSSSLPYSCADGLCGADVRMSRGLVVELARVVHGHPEGDGRLGGGGVPGAVDQAAVVPDQEVAL